MAATPSPRPVRPRPSVVVAETVTGAPAASLRAASASARRGPRRGRLPITWTATLPIAKPAARTRRGGLAEQRDAGGAGPRGVGGAELAAEVAEPGGREQRVARGVGRDVAVGVTLQAVVLLGPGEAGEVHRHARRQAVHVDADADAGQRSVGTSPGRKASSFTGRSCLRRQSRGEDVPARLVAGRRGRRRGRPRHELLRGDGDDHPRVAGRRRGRGGHPADARPGGRAGHQHPRAPTTSRSWSSVCSSCSCCCSPGPGGWRAGRGGSRCCCSPSSRCSAGSPSRPSAAPGPPTSARRRRLRDLGGVPVDPRRQPARAPSARPSERAAGRDQRRPTRPRRGAGSSSAPGVMVVASVGVAVLGRVWAGAVARSRSRGGCCACPASAEPCRPPACRSTSTASRRGGRRTTTST